VAPAAAAAATAQADENMFTNPRDQAKTKQMHAAGRAAAAVASLSQPGTGTLIAPENLKQSIDTDFTDSSGDEDTSPAAVIESVGGSWEAQLARLVVYKAAHGNCHVPRSDVALGRWVADQRAFKKKLDKGQPSRGMTAERATKLTALGLVWEGNPGCSRPNDVAWEAKLAQLAAYKVVHGNCDVPQDWADDVAFGRWVSNQRMFKKKLQMGQPSTGMTAERAAKLTLLGLV
jgi:hypothetical protein